MLNNEPQWVAIYTRARAEKQVDARLKQMGYESYLPIRREKHKWKDRTKMVDVPLMSSYVFVKIRGKDVVPVRSVDGVSWIVAFGNVIQTIPEWQIEGMRRFLASEQRLFVKQDNALKRGAMVKIVSGHFTGLRGELVSNCKEGNFSIRINALSMMIVTEIDKGLLEPILDEK